VAVTPDLSFRWQVAADPQAVHDLLLASDEYHAAANGLQVPARRLESTRRLVAGGAVHVLTRGRELAAMYTLTSEPPFSEELSIFPAARCPRYLQRLAVEPGWLARTPLLGLRCLRHAVGQAARSGADVLRSEANPDLRATASLLAAAGFVRYGPIRTSGPLRRMYLQKDLGPDAR
jgi:hypothetical protein